MIEFISFRYDYSHTRCSVCLDDCFHHTFFLKECGHSFCMKCVKVYFDGIKKDINMGCPCCISISPSIAPLKEEAPDTRPHAQPPCHTEEASLLR